MSRIGKKPITVPQGVTVTIDGNTVRVKGPRGELERTLHRDVVVERDETGQIVVRRPSDEPQHRALHGLSRTLVANMVDGVSKGFTKRLQISGVGYRASTEGKILNLQLGYSHDIKYAVPADIDVRCESPTSIAITGADRQRVGQIAAEIRSFRPPEPYKGKGIRYEGEQILRKEGKKK